ncbi:MAG TPA: hypothetical protein VN894_11085, partial [Polyangiaceae bacterium]|nr:hypothetical protein [Polyangiaceae bacterium]
FVKDADEALAETKGDPDGVKPDQIAQEIRCAELLSTPSLVSIGCASSTNLGGAHPEGQRFAYSYGICAGKGPKPVTLGGVCRSGAPCVKTVVAAINRSLASGPAKDANVKISEQSSALEHFAVTKTGLRFFVNDELPQALQAAGAVDVPFRDLKSVLREDGPLAELLR